MNSMQEKVFRSAMDLWKHDTLFVSSVHQMMEHPSYTTIKTMGADAIEPLLEELAEYPWIAICVALGAITGAFPYVDKNDYGKVPVIALAWFDWGHKNGYLDAQKLDRLQAALKEAFRE